MSDRGVLIEDPMGGGFEAPPEQAPLPTDEVGSTGLLQFSGRIHEEFLTQLEGDRGRKVFREMADNDPVVGSVLFAIDMLMRGVEWRIDPADESVHAFDVAEFVESCMTDMSSSWSETLSSILSFLPFGWSFTELVYKVRGGLNTKNPRRRSEFDDGKIGWRKIAIRPQDSLFRWEFDEDGGTQGMWQQAPPYWKPTFIPIEKSLLFRTQSFKNNPEGRSVLRTAYRPWFMKKRIEEIEAVGAERDLAGLPIAWVPPTMLMDTASSTETAALNVIKGIVSSIKRDEQEGLVFPLAYDERGNKRYDLTLLSTGGRRQFDTDGIINRYDQRIAMTVLADFILLGHENVGSFALSSSKVDLFSVALGAWLDEIATVFNRYALPRLMELNNIDMELQPTLSHADVKRVDIGELGNYITALSGAGMPLFPDTALEDHLRTAANLPEHDPDEAGTAQVAQAQPGATQQQVPGPPAKQPAAGKQIPQGPQQMPPTARPSKNTAATPAKAPKPALPAKG